jgi:hypothetical protein
VHSLLLNARKGSQQAWRSRGGWFDLPIVGSQVPPTSQQVGRILGVIKMAYAVPRRLNLMRIVNQKQRCFCWLIGCFAVFLIVHPVFGQETKGEIIGTVVDERGSPVPNAQVSPQYLGVALFRSLVISVDTDVHGRFTIDHLDWGRYAVHAGKEADGYPNTRFRLYQTRSAPQVSLSPQHIVRRVTVKIGPKGGVLVSSVRDAVTHTPVATQLVLKKHDGSGRIYLSEPPDFQVLLPADTDVLIEIRKEGYEPWVYATASRRSIRLKSGVRMRLEVNLTPSVRGEKGGPSLHDHDRGCLTLRAFQRVSNTNDYKSRFLRLLSSLRRWKQLAVIKCRYPAP